VETKLVSESNCLILLFVLEALNLFIGLFDKELFGKVLFLKFLFFELLKGFSKSKSQDSEVELELLVNVAFCI